ncbi:hypothetical protein [Massilia rhizosphaerae]|uniref:hypothetical protein n=1 Tax=Massilia rhizosphaerae TaxID=2784389 RepID=UPI0018DE452E|nr:hypothetical protein [Massilia rhizosphaerae]
MNDDNAGLGGSYMLDPTTGKRTLVARTEPPAEAAAQIDEPAEAGFFTPVEPADTTTTTE